MEVKEILKKRRLELGLTMKEVADKVGVSEGTISRWESGEIANMRRDKIISLASALKLTPSIVMGWEAPPEELTLYRKLRPDESHLLGNYNLLNDNGKDKAQEYVEDLSDNPKYTEEVWLNAAHQRTDTELSGTSHDDDIMDDDSGWN